MKCFNCGERVPDGAKRCMHCEADLTEMAGVSEEDMKAAEEALEQIMPGALEQLRVMAENFDTAEDFVNAIFVGACPACGSGDVGTFEDVVGIEDPTVARCFDCEHVWCTECRRPVADPEVGCGHWDVCVACGEEDDCPFLGDSTECPDVAAWLEDQRDAEPDDASSHSADPEADDTKSTARGRVERDDRLFTLEVCIMGGPMSEEFVEKNRVVCRTIRILGDQTLADLHDAIFDAFDRYENHMYEFQIGGEGPMDPRAGRYVLPMAVEALPGQSPDGTVATPVGALGLEEGDVFGYWFDFGDDWWHQINVVEIADDAGSGTYPKVTERIGDSPPQYADFDNEEEDDE